MNIELYQFKTSRNLIGGIYNGEEMIINGICIYKGDKVLLDNDKNIIAIPFGYKDSNEDRRKKIWIIHLIKDKLITIEMGEDDEYIEFDNYKLSMDDFMGLKNYNGGN